MQTATLETVAREAYDALETRTRDDGTEYVARRDNAPEWVQDLCFAAHGDMLPDDWRYACIRAALGSIVDDGYDEDDGAHTFADAHTDVYTGRLTEWLGSHLYRPGYCDDATEEYGEGIDGGIVATIARGQYAEALEVYGLVVDALRERLDWIETRLEEIRAELRAEEICYGAIVELQDFAPYIAPGDVELLEAAGVPEFPEEDDAA
jgi:hypothetical protein